MCIRDRPQWYGIRRRLRRVRSTPMTNAAVPDDGPKQSHRWWKITLGAIAALLLIAVFGVAVFMRFSVHRAFPDVDGDVAIAGLQAPVEVVRDTMGIANIYADTTHDLFMAQGYVHAQERFWQMDFWRHIGSGRLSEMFGDSQLDTDRFLRTMGWARVAQQELDALDKESLAALQAYSDGVNAYLEQHPSNSSVSREYAVLGLTNRGYKIEPWKPEHTLTWAKVM